jgi:hypothetical protein
VAKEPVVLNNGDDLAPGTVFVDSVGDYIYVSENNDTPLEIALRFRMRAGELVRYITRTNLTLLSTDLCFVQLRVNKEWYLPDLKMVQHRSTHVPLTLPH